MHASTDRPTFSPTAALLPVPAALVFAIVFPGYNPKPHDVPVGLHE